MNKPEFSTRTDIKYSKPILICEKIIKDNDIKTAKLINSKVTIKNGLKEVEHLDDISFSRLKSKSSLVYSDAIKVLNLTKKAML